MPQVVRTATRVQDQDDFAGALTGGSFLQYVSATGKFQLAVAAASVSNGDGTLTVSPTTGAVVASLALGHANTWTALQTFQAATSGVALVARAAATTPGDIQQWLSSAGASLNTYVDSTGQVFARNLRLNGADTTNTVYQANGDLGLSTSNGHVKLIAPTNFSVIIVPTGNQPFIVRGATGRSAVLVQLQGQSSTTTGRPQVDFDTAWADSTDATRKARGTLSAWDTAARECVRWEASGTAALVSFFGVTAVAQQAVGAAATDAASTQTLANNLRTALINLGLCKT